MSYFHDGVVHVIIPSDDITEEMVNNSKNSFNSNLDSLRTTLPGVTPELTLIKVRVPVSHVFDGYEWHNCKDIMTILSGPDWSHDLSIDTGE